MQLINTVHGGVTPDEGHTRKVKCLIISAPSRHSDSSVRATNKSQTRKEARGEREANMSQTRTSYNDRMQIVQFH